MAYEHKPGSFSLFKNDKGDNEKRPDYKGSGKDADGRDIEISAWLRDGKNDGPRWLSCQFKLKDSRPQQQSTPAQDALAETKQDEPAPARSNAHFSNMKDDIPF